MAKKSKPVLEGPVKMKPTLYLGSDSGVKVPESIKKSKLGKILSLVVKVKLISQRISQDIGRKQSESYDLEIQKINEPNSKLEKVLRA